MGCRGAGLELGWAEGQGWGGWAGSWAWESRADESVMPVPGKAAYAWKRNLHRRVFLCCRNKQLLSPVLFPVSSSVQHLAGLPAVNGDTYGECLVLGTQLEVQRAPVHGTPALRYLGVEICLSSVIKLCEYFKLGQIAAAPVEIWGCLCIPTCLSRSHPLV